MNEPQSDIPTLVSETESIEIVISARKRDLGGFSVDRALPSYKRRMVGPFIFLDHMGPATFEPGQGMDVRPHPHICLATVTYLFEGEITHRDSLGSKQEIRPGDVNWMVAGRGIAHSERTPPDVRARGSRIHGLQSWVALPTSAEESEPRFEHHPKATLPSLQRGGVTFDVVAGTFEGATSPVGVAWPTLYVHAHVSERSEITLGTEHEERAVFLVEGAASVDGQEFPAGTLLILRHGVEARFEAESGCRMMVLGGKRMDSTRHIWWNFVASSEDRIERAKSDWKDGKFPKVVGDEIEFIPLPER
jgi:redox-sensitive bicupin YhaK (pirin superfamily)